MGVWHNVRVQAKSTDAVKFRAGVRLLLKDVVTRDIRLAIVAEGMLENVDAASAKAVAVSIRESLLKEDPGASDIRVWVFATPQPLLRVKFDEHGNMQ
jgi:hypothetical protein